MPACACKNAKNATKNKFIANKYIENKAIRRNRYKYVEKNFRT